MPSALAPFAFAPLDPQRKAQLLERYATLASGREKPGRFWRVDLESAASERPEPAPYAAPVIEAPPIRGGFAVDILSGARDHAGLFAGAFGGAVAHDDAKFAALAAALCNTGAFVYVPPGVSVDEPVQITYRASQGALFPYTLVLLGEGARCTVIERLEGADGAFVCGIDEVLAAQSSSAILICEQTLPEDARMFFTRVARPSANANVQFGVAHLGSHLVLDAVDIRIEAPGVEATIDGLFFPRGNQHVDLITNVSHNAGSSQSHTTIKSAATGNGQARYLGNIRIAAHAQKTQAALRDDALLLSEHAHIDSVPALEIAANDVKAFHGATIGALDEEQVFYMTSRGLTREQSEKMIALGFFEPVIEHFPGNALRERLRAALAAKISS